MYNFISGTDLIIFSNYLYKIINTFALPVIGKLLLYRVAVMSAEKENA